MNKASKGGSVLWIIMTIISLFCVVGLLLFMLQERSKRIETEQKLSDSVKAKRSLEIKLDHAQLDLIRLKDQAEVLAKQVEQEKKGYRDALENLAKKDRQLTELESELADEKKQRVGLTNTLAQLRESHKDLAEELKESKVKFEDFKGQPTKFTGKPSVNLRKIVVKPKKQLSGKVLVINREFHFVVIDLGRKNGVNLGDEFVVYRHAQEVGKVQVEKVYDGMSTAAILSGSEEFEIDEGSIIKSF